MLENSLRSLEESQRNAPRDRWDPDYVITKVGKSPDALFAWVRDNTYWIPYHGILRDARGVLMDRQGNSLDRALLLATLVQKAGHPVRLAHRKLTGEEAQTLFPEILDGPPPSVETKPEPSQRDASVATVAARYDVGKSDVRNALEQEDKAYDDLYSDL